MVLWWVYLLVWIASYYLYWTIVYVLFVVDKPLTCALHRPLTFLSYAERQSGGMLMN